MTQAEIIYRIIALAILITVFGLFIVLMIKIQNDQIREAKEKMDLEDEIIKSKINSESLSDLVDSNNKSRSDKS
jgi:hypothetical protein